MNTERPLLVARLPIASNPSGFPRSSFGGIIVDEHQVSREHLWLSVRHSAERAAEARKEADRLACVAWTQRMLGFKGPAQPSPSLGDALNAEYLYLRSCLADASDCGVEHRPPAEGDAHPRTGTIHALQALLAGSRLSVKEHLALRPTKISALDPPSKWWLGER